MITSDSIMKFGKYKNRKISTVPLDYLIQTYKSTIHSTKNDDHKEFNEYIESTLDIPVLNPKVSILKAVDDFAKNMCPKEFFISQSDAKYRLDYIRKMNVNSDKKIPVRAYECEKCGYWHLTSRPMNGYGNPIVEKDNEYESPLKDKWLKLMSNEN